MPLKANEFFEPASPVLRPEEIREDQMSQPEDSRGLVGLDIEREIHEHRLVIGHPKRIGCVEADDLSRALEVDVVHASTAENVVETSAAIAWPASRPMRSSRRAGTLVAGVLRSSSILEGRLSKPRGVASGWLVSRPSQSHQCVDSTAI